MASTEAGPSDSEAQKKPTAGQRKAERAAKVREKQEASKRLLGDYNDLTKQIQGRSEIIILLLLCLKFTTPFLLIDGVMLWHSGTVDLNEGQTFGTVLQRLNGLHTRSEFVSCLHLACLLAQRLARTCIIPSPSLMGKCF